MGCCFVIAIVAAVGHLGRTVADIVKFKTVTVGISTMLTFVARHPIQMDLMFAIAIKIGIADTTG